MIESMSLVDKKYFYCGSLSNTAATGNIMDFLISFDNDQLFQIYDSSIADPYIPVICSRWRYIQKYLFGETHVEV